MSENREELRIRHEAEMKAFCETWDDAMQQIGAPAAVTIQRPGAVKYVPHTSYFEWNRPRLSATWEHLPCITTGAQRPASPLAHNPFRSFR